MLLRTLALLTTVFLPALAQAADRECAQSPGKVIEVCVFARDGGAFYAVSRLGKPVLAPSALGLSFEALGLRHELGAALGRAAGDPRQPFGTDGFADRRHAAEQERSTSPSGCSMTASASATPTPSPLAGGRGHRRAHRVQAGRRLSAWWYEGLGQERDEYLYTQTDARRITLAETPLTLKRSDGLHLSFHEAAWSTSRACC
jgi:alpha-glucosidase